MSDGTKNGETARKEVRRGHDFDGIDEFDNDMPRWWVNLFISTVVFAAAYMAWFHLPGLPGQSIAEEYASASGELLAEARDASARGAGREDWAGLMAKNETVESGKKTFATNCAPCHAADGGGGVGPNLADAYWIHAKDLGEVQQVIENGVADKGMPAWREILGSARIRDLTAFIATMQGSTPATPKAPQGDARELMLPGK